MNPFNLGDLEWMVMPTLLLELSRSTHLKRVAKKLNALIGIENF